MPGIFSSGKVDAAVDNDDVVAVFIDRHFFADFPHSA